MKTKFHAYYKPDEAFFKNLWKDSLIALDANVLLNLYTYSNSTTDEILKLLEGLKERLWLPHQAALEYHENRCGIIDKERKRYSSFTSSLDKIGEELAAKNRHPFIDGSLLEDFKALAQKIKQAIESGKNSHGALLKDDSIGNRIAAIFEGRVGDEYSIELCRRILESIY